MSFYVTFSISFVFCVNVGFPKNKVNGRLLIMCTYFLLLFEFLFQGKSAPSYLIEACRVFFGSGGQISGIKTALCDTWFFEVSSSQLAMPREIGQ